jgi:hypothetical protein
VMTMERAEKMRAAFVKDAGPKHAKLDAYRDKIIAETEVESRAIEAKYDKLRTEQGPIPDVGDPKRADWFAQRAAWYSEQQKEREPVWAKRRAVQNVKAGQIATDRKHFEAPNPIEIDAVFVNRFTQKEKAIVESTVEQYNKLIDAAAWTNPIKRIGINNSKRRGHYYNAQIWIEPAESERKVIVHEISHGLERMNPSILRQANEFLDYRTPGEKQQSLRKLTGIRGYKRDETTRADKFKNPYVGKFYDRKDFGGDIGNVQEYTEVISMAVQYMYENPYQFAIDDPEYFNFILTIIRGGKWQPLK